MDSGTAGLDTQNPQAQLELKDRALASSEEGITIADASLPDNPLIYANAGFEKITGYAVADVIGRNCRFLQGRGTDPGAVERLRMAVRNKQAVTETLLNYRKDGTPFWNRLSITPVRDSAGLVTHFIGVQSDVTEEKQAKDALEKANLRLEAVSRLLRKDLEAAAEVQRSLLPDSFPFVTGVRFAFRFRPCADVGGDCLNVLPLDSRRIGFYILDVSGHGVASSLLSVTLCHMLSVVPDRSFLFQPDPSHEGKHCIAAPADVVARLNRHFLGNPQFFTMIYGILDTSTAEFRYVSAGHLSPLHFRSGQPMPLTEASGIPVGLLPGASYEERSITLRTGDRLYLCTDGVLEAENPAQQEFGVPRLLDALSRYSHLPIDDTLAALIERVDEWSMPLGPADDASVLAMEYAR